MASRDFAFIQTAANRVFIGWGPFEQSPMRRPERPAFYIADFFLDDPHPWRHPSEWEELSFDALIERFGSAPAPKIEWEPLPLDAFRPLFDSAKSAMRRGDFNKIVPVIFENGRLLERTDLWPWLFRQLARLPVGMSAYGYSYQNHGLAGATPEMLFASDGRGYRTMALAGTRPADRASELLRDPKGTARTSHGRRRHRPPPRTVRKHRSRTDRHPRAARNRTSRDADSIRGDRHRADVLRRNGPPPPPTAALGVSPRTEAGEHWLREADRGVKRRTHGAPFGLELADQRALALVAIRNVQWHGDAIRVGAGAGLLPESQLEREFDELREKREQVKALLGLRAPVAIEA